MKSKFITNSISKSHTDNKFSRIKDVRSEGFPCPETKCNRLFETITSVELHWTNVHVRTNDKDCKLCGEIFATIFHVIQHYRETHRLSNRDGYKCPNCSLPFLNISLLESHWDREHNAFKINKFICPYCKEPFASQASLERHVNALHPYEDLGIHS